jgi:hypothetical protein
VGFFASGGYKVGNYWRDIMKRLLIALALATPAFASQVHDDMHDAIMPVLNQHPQITEVEICTNGSCEIFAQRKGGSAEILYQRPKGGGEEGSIANAVGGIVGAASSKVGAGGRIVVDYHKKPNGEVKVHVEVSIGVGAAAEAAASGSGEK